MGCEAGVCFGCDLWKLVGHTTGRPLVPIWMEIDHQWMNAAHLIQFSGTQPHGCRWESNATVRLCLTHTKWLNTGDTKFH